MKKYQYISIILFVVASAVTAYAQSFYPGQSSARSVAIVPEMKAESFDLSDVRLLPSRFRENFERDSAWLMSISADRLLHSFRNTSGAFASREGGYMTVKKLGGWESLDCDLRGHTTGHILSALAFMYASTGSECFKAKADSLVSGLAKVQAAYGNGYLSAYAEGLIDRNLKGQSVWAPWYTLHKILAGLLDQYIYTGNETALEIACGMGDWAWEKLQPLDSAARAKMLRNEFGGVPETFLNLYALTGNEKYSWLSDFFCQEAVILPLRASEEDFGTKHTNTFIPKVLAEARRYELTGDTAGRMAAEFFFASMLDGHTFAPGCSSDKEHFFPVSDFSKHISGYTGETCCTYNMLKLARHLFCWSASPEIADYYERALYNHILGQQNPETGMVCYFLPLAAGTHKVYSTPENSFWCCVGSGFENHAKYGESIYYHKGDSLYVNLFIPSELSWKDKGLKIKMETNFPQQETIRLTVQTDAPTTAVLRLRYPSWSGKPEVKINGKKINIMMAEGQFFTVKRKFKDGDTIQVRYPMHLYTESAPDNPSVAAILYGPAVLAGRLGTEGFEGCQPVSDPEKYNGYYTYDYKIPEGMESSSKIGASAEHPEEAVTKTGEGLVFRTKDGIVLEPLYDIHNERYVVYWDFNCGNE